MVFHSHDSGRATAEPYDCGVISSVRGDSAVDVTVASREDSSENESFFAISRAGGAALLRRM